MAIKIDKVGGIYQIQGLAKTLSGDIVKALMDNIAESLKEEINNLADETLGGDAETYKNAVEVRKDGDYNFSIVLNDKKAAGLDQRDMKPNLLRNAKTAKDGSKYKVIPIAHGTSGAKTSDDVRTQTQLRNFIKKERLDRIRRNNKGKPLTGIVARSKSTEGIPTNFHRLVRVQENAKNKKGTSSTMMTFRTVSSKSPADSWIYPAKQGVDIKNKIRAKLDGIIDKEIGRLRGR